MNTIEIKNLTKDYGNDKGIFDLNFEINEGEVFGYLGPNGAGKTTTIRNLLGFCSPTMGSCTIREMDCRKQANQIQKILGYLPGEIAFMDEMKGMQLIKFIAEMKGLTDLTKANELIERFELDPSGKIKKMSKGMKQKIGIVCAFMADPQVIVLDEPTSGLDPLMQNTFVDLILEEKQKGKTILMSSHIFEEVEKTCDRIAIIRNGRLVDIEKTEELSARKQKDYIITLETPEMAQIFAAEAGDVKAVEDNKVKISVHGELMPLIQLMGMYQIKDIETKSQTLEEIFMHYYGGEKHDK